MSLSALLSKGTIQQVRRGVDQAAGQVLDRLAALTRAAPTDRLAQVVESPLGRLPIEAIFWQMPRQIDRQRGRAVNTAARWRITSRQGRQVDTYDLIVAAGSAQVQRGGGEVTPPVTITVDRTVFLRIASGGADPMRAYFKGELAISGDIMAAAKLVSLFRIPRARGKRTTA